jgi:diguanylate cyclase (GGDEF)-like protein
VADEAKLSDVLSQFARTLATDFPIQGILDHLVKRIVTVLPITAAGVTLISAGMAPQYIAASDESALRFERLQTDVGQGPCLAAYMTGAAVAVPDLANDDRFPLFGLAAVASGLAAVFTFPLRHGDTPLGALDLYRDTPGALGAHDMEAAQTLADVTTAYLLNAQARDEARLTSDRFRHRALHDQLTGLANRVMLQQRLEHAAQRARRSHCTTGLLFVDLDKFKKVNDSYGHHVGDQLLIAVAQRLSRLVRPGDTLARLSGDEFVFLCEDLRGATDVEILAKRVEDSFSEPFILAGTQIAVTVSVGMASAAPGEVVSDQLLIGADTAMYQAKRKGGAGHQIVDLREASLAEDRSTFESDLRFAFTDKRLTLAYQPVVRSHDKSLVGTEALLRWTDPVRGVVPASSIVSVAEQSGLITKIGAWVLEQACLDRGRWLAVGVPLDVAVNVSTRQLMSPNFGAGVATVLTSTGMDPAALVLEITENVFIEDIDRAATVLSELKELGVRLALDDFGTGYSSLSYLKRLPIDIVKIDQSFVADLERFGTGRTMVAAMTNLSHALGLVVTAEGVETIRQHDEVRAIGCEFAQGFLYGCPVPASQIGELRRHLSAAAPMCDGIDLAEPAHDAMANVPVRPRMSSQAAEAS